MATLKDIAQATGVSVSVVSRVLNPTPDRNARVAIATRAAIRKAARRLDFRRNRAAEFLRRGRSATLGVFLPDVPNSLLSCLVLGISEVATARGFPISFYFGRRLEQYRLFLEEVRETSLSGVLTYPFAENSERVAIQLAKFRKDGGHLLLMNSAQEVAGAPAICFDEVHGGRLAARHLLGRNCARYWASSRYRARTDGFVKELQEEGQSCAIGTEEDFPAFLAASTQGAALGVFATSTKEALVIMKACRTAGRRVGSDVKLVGYDDHYFSDLFDPPLTTVDQPFREQGSRAVSKIINMIYGQPESSEVMLPRLIVRESA